MDDFLEPEAIDALRRNRKIEAIKIVREKRGIGLKEAKEFVESFEGKVKPDVNPSQNTLGIERSSKGGPAKIIAVVIILIVGGFLAFQMLNPPS